MTNFERITQSPESLVKVVTPMCVCCPVKNCNLHNHGNYFCIRKFYKWLKEPEQDGTI